jgi:hypothetical protein
MPDVTSTPSPAAKILSVVETAYRATLEEQDDPVLWLSQALRGAGASVHLLLRGAAVNYAVRGQDASGLRFGVRAQTQPPRIERDLLALRSKGASIHYVQEDLAARGLHPDELVPGLEPVRAEDLPRLFRGFDLVWHW